MTRKRFTLLAIFVSFLIFLSPVEGLGTQYDIDADKYTGYWYEMYQNYWSAEHAGTHDAECMTTEYEEAGTNFMMVKAFDLPEGNRVVVSNAWIPDASEPGKVLYRIDGNTDTREYHIIKLGPVVNGQYEYSIVTDSRAEELHVIARDPERFDVMYDAEVTEYLLITRFTTPTTQRLRIPHGPDCNYHPPI